MLSAILLAFIVTWSPYNLFTVIQTFCTTCINPYNLFTVIQTFCTTCINPSLYAVGESNPRVYNLLLYAA